MTKEFVFSLLGGIIAAFTAVHVRVSDLVEDCNTHQSIVLKGKTYTCVEKK